MLFSVIVNSSALAPAVMRAERAASPLPTVIVGTSPPLMPGMRAVMVTGWPSRTLTDPGAISMV